MKYETYGCPFVTPGAAGTTFKLYDMKVVGTLTAATKKGNFIQMFQPNTLKFDSVNSFYWDYAKTSAVTGETGCWCYKNSDDTTGQVANAEVLTAASISIAPGEAFFFNSPTTGKDICIKIKVPAAITALSSND